MAEPRIGSTLVDILVSRSPEGGVIYKFSCGGIVEVQRKRLTRDGGGMEGPVRMVRKPTPQEQEAADRGDSFA
jgi:hypothetical protein